MPVKLTPTAVALSPKTGKPIKRPRPGALVHYAYVGPRGGIKRLTKYAQSYSQNDLKSIQRLAAKTEGGTFALYEQLTTRNKRDKNGKVLHRMRDGKLVLDSRGRPIPLKETKLTAIPRAGKQRPVMFRLGRRVQHVVQDHAFRALTPREKVDLKLARMVKLTKADGVFTKEMHVTGKTIFDTVKNLRPDVTAPELKKRGLVGLMVEGRVRIKSTKGETLAAIPFSVRVNALWNFPQLIAKEIRHALGQIGYRFTSLAELYKLQEKADRVPGKEVDLFRMGPVGRAKVDRLKPLRPETKQGTIKKGGKGPEVSVSLRLTGIKGREKKRKGKR